MPMPHLLRFARTRTTSVERTAPDTLQAACRLQDNLQDAEVAVTVGLPDLDIRSVHPRVTRDERGLCSENLDPLQKVVGVRIGPGMAKIMQGLVGESFPCRQLVFMVEECCHGVILYFTKDELEAVPEDVDEARKHFAEMIRTNIRLYNRCAAFGPDSSITKDIEPPAPGSSS